MHNYEELGVCGEGAYGQVLKCKSKSRNKPVAIKRMKKSAIDDKAKRELGILQRLTHSNVVGLLDSFTDPKNLYLVFEYMDCDVMALMGAFETGMPMHQVKSITAQTCRAIDYCHREGIVHRDLKLENLLISKKTNRVKLCDFGVARHIGDGKGQYTQYVATRWYRAPELLVAPPSGGSAKEGLQRVVRSNNIPYSFPVDAWGIGCILAELATGCPFFPGETDVKQLAIIRAHGGQGQGAAENCEEVLAKRVPQFKAHPAGLELLIGFFQMNPAARMTPHSALQHEFLGGEEESDSDSGGRPSSKKKKKSKKKHKKSKKQTPKAQAHSDIDTDIDNGLNESTDYGGYSDESFESLEADGL